MGLMFVGIWQCADADLESFEHDVSTAKHKLWRSLRHVSGQPPLEFPPEAFLRSWRSLNAELERRIVNTASPGARAPGKNVPEQRRRPLSEL